MDANLFSEGSIYFYQNKTNVKKDYENPDLNHDFIVSRPVYVIKNRELPFDSFTVNILVITSSSHRVGIPINIDGCKDGKVLPYGIHSVHKENLIQYMGRASDDIISEVRDAVAYHEGYSDIKPKYLIDFEKRVETEKKMLDKMSLKEKSVYLFLKEKCTINPNFIVSYNELFLAYLKYSEGEGYVRTQDFSKVLSKHIANLNGVTIQTKNKIKILHGISLIGNVHRTTDPNDIIQVVRASQDISKTRLLDNTMSNATLYEYLSSQSKKFYDKLDIIQKLEYYSMSAENINVNGTMSDADRRTIKKMISNDITEKQTKLFKQLDDGMSPLNMKTTDQYVLYICSNNQLRNHVKPIYLKSGGVNRLKKELRKNIKHYFSKMK